MLSQEKTIAVVFSRKRAAGHHIPNLTLNGVPIEWKNEVKFLETIFDCRSWAAEPWGSGGANALPQFFEGGCPPSIF